MLIINPVSGKGRVKGFTMDILNVLCEGGNGVTVFITEKAGDATQFAAEYGGEVDRIACTGGDGTLNEVICGLMKLPKEERPAIGYIPLGTTNDMAASLNIPKAPKDAIERLSQLTPFQEPRMMDIGRIGDDYFGYVAAFGTFTDIPFTTPQEAKNTWGYLAYVTEALGRLGRIEPIHAKIEYEDGVIEDEFMLGFVVNSTRIAGGLVRFPEDDVALDDGLFEVLLIRNPKNVIELRNSVSDLMHRNFNTDSIILFHTRKVSFEFERPIQWTRDGEDGGIYESVEITNLEKAVRIFV